MDELHNGPTQCNDQTNFLGTMSVSLSVTLVTVKTFELAQKCCFGLQCHHVRLGMFSAKAMNILFHFPFLFVFVFCFFFCEACVAMALRAVKEKHISFQSTSQ